MHMHCKRCEHCGTTKGRFHVDHIVPLNQGGLDEISNLQFYVRVVTCENLVASTRLR